MAIAKDSLLIDIAVDTKNASSSIDIIKNQLKGFEEVLKGMSKTSERTSKSIDSLGAAAVKLNQVLELSKKIGTALIGPFKESVSAFIASSDAQQRLSNAIRLTGGSVDKTMDRFERFAKTIQQTTVVEDDHVTSLLAQAKAFGLNDDMAEQLISSSIDLAAATGRNVDEAFQGLMQTMKGSARGLREYSVYLSDLSEEQLRAGKGIERVGEIFKGFGESQLKTLTGQFQQTKNMIGDIFEDIGEIIVKGLDIRGANQSFNTSLLEMKDTLSSFKEGAIASLRSFSSSVSLAFSALSSVDFKALSEKVLVFASAIGVMIAAMNIGSIIAFTKALYAAIVPMAILSAKFIAIALAIGVVATAIDLLISNFDLLMDKIKNVFAGIGKVFARAGQVKGMAMVGPQAFDDAQAKKLNETLQETADTYVEIEEVKKKAWDWGFIGEVANQGSKFFSVIDKGANASADAAKNLDDELKAIDSKFRNLGGIKSLSEDQKKVLEDLIKKNRELGIEIARAEQTSLGAIEVQRKADIEGIRLLEERLTKEGKMSPLIQEQINKQIELMNIRSKALSLKELDAYREKTFQVNEEINSQEMLRIDLIQRQRDLEMQDVASMREKLTAEGIYNADMEKILASREEAISKRADIEKAKAPSKEFEEPAKAGLEIAHAMTAGMEGVAGAALGFMTGAGSVLDAAQGLVDLIPNMLSKVSNLVNSITQLPLKILEGLKGVFTAVLDFVKNLIPNIIAAVSGILDAAVSFVETLPDVFADMMAKLPDMLLKLIDKLPDLVERLVTGLIENAPKIAMALVTWMAEGMPKVALKLLDYMVTKLPKAIWMGIIKGLQSVFGMVGDLLKGKLPKVSVDTKALTNSMKQAARQLTGEASKLFAVMDLTDVAKGFGPEQITGAIEDGFRRGSNWLKKLWDDFLRLLKDVWMWVYDNIIKPIWDIITKVWQWVWDNVLKPIIDGLKAIWDWVYQNIIQPLIEGLKAIWQFVYDNVIKPLLDGLKSVWDFVVTNIIEPLINGLQAVWNFFVEKILGPFIDGIQAVWTFFKEKILDKFAEGVRAVFDWVKQNVIDPLLSIGGKIWDGLKSGLSGATDFFKGIGTTIWNSVKSGFDGFSFGSIGTKMWEGLKNGINGIGNILENVFNAINPANMFEKMFRIPDSAWGKGDVENALSRITGADIDIPFAKFAEGGKVPGRGTVPGDSFLNDRVLALLSPGEAIIPRSLMNNPYVSNVIDMLLSGRLKPSRYAFGGVKVGGTLGKVVSGDVQGSITDVQQGLQNFGEQAADTAEGIWTSIGDAMQYLNPAKMWDMLKDEFYNSVWKIFESNTLHSGGLVGFAEGGEVPALLNSGEYVVNRGGVNGAGIGMLNAINRGESVRGDTVINLNIDIKTTESIDDAYFRNKLVPRIKDELRRASLDGAFIISSKGVRT